MAQTFIVKKTNVSNANAFYFLKLTNWGNILNTMYGVTGALVVTIRESDYNRGR